MHLVHHQAADEMNIARKPIQLGDAYGGLGPLRLLQGGAKLRPPLERISAIAGFDLGVFGGDREALGLGERGDGGALRFEAKA